MPDSTGPPLLERAGRRVTILKAFGCCRAVRGLERSICSSWPGVWDFSLELDCDRSAIAQTRGVLGATDRDSRGRPTRPLGLSPSSSRATPTESEEVMSSETQRNRRKAPGTKPVMTPPDVGRSNQMEIVEARVEHLEAELEGLQDAIHRQSVLRDERRDELVRRTEPPRSRGSSARTRGSAESDGVFACGSLTCGRSSRSPRAP